MTEINGGGGYNKHAIINGKNKKWEGKVRQKQKIMKATVTAALVLALSGCQGNDANVDNTVNGVQESKNEVQNTDSSLNESESKVVSDEEKNTQVEEPLDKITWKRTADNWVSNGTTTVEEEIYDDDGNKTEYSRYTLAAGSSDKQLIEHYTYKYNDAGNVTEEWIDFAEGAERDYYEYYEYDEAGNLISDRSVDEKGIYAGEWRYTYNSDNEQIGKIYTDGDGNVKQEETKTILEDGSYIIEKSNEAGLSSHREYDAEGKIQREETYNAATGMLTNLITYNKDGRTARNEYYNSDTGIIESLDNWEYDEYGYGTRELIESYIDGNLVSQDIKSYEYVRDAEGNVLVRDDYYEYVYYEYDYDYSGDSVIATMVGEERDDRVLECRYEMAYDEKGNKISEKTYYYDGSEAFLSEAVTYKYDNDGNKIEEIHTDSDGNVIQGNRDTYDGEGREVERAHYSVDNGDWCIEYKKIFDGDNMIRSTNYSEDGEISSEIVCVYKFGNIVSETYYGNGGETAGEISRQIIYEYR